jgi:cell fate (sporulation/competence/biofilm development) regulator YmcA (YheA/YmcA/DUF963 family)
MSKQNLKIFTKQIKTVKKVPKTVLVEHKLSDHEKVLKKLKDLQKLQEPYIEVQDLDKKTKTIYSKTLNALVYTKKEFKGL